MNASSINVVYNDGTTHAVKLGPKDYVAFERQYQQPVTVLANEASVRVEYIYFLAWSALSRLGLESRIFDDFLNVVTDVALKEEAPLAGTPSSTS